MMKTRSRFFVRLLLAVAVILELFASSTISFVTSFESSSREPTLVVTLANPAPAVPEKELRARKALETAIHIAILLGILGTMALWARIEFQWHMEDASQGVVPQSSG